MIPAEGTSSRPARAGHLAARDIDGLLFVAEMYGVQLDQLATMLGVGEPGARAITARWRAQGYVDSARLGPGRPWVWLTRGGLAACGLPYTATQPALSRLAHLRAVTAVRLALEPVSAYAAAGAFWRSERRLRSRTGGRVGLRDHMPDGEVHWPGGSGTASPGTATPGTTSPGATSPGATSPGTSGPGVAWAGECWAIEAELTAKTVSRTAAIMRELLARTGEYGCPAADIAVPGRPARHARVLYLCSPAALPTVARARDALGSSGARIEIRRLPPAAAMVPAAPRDQEP
jgi:hypothetical protein